MTMDVRNESLQYFFEFQWQRNNKKKKKKWWTHSMRKIIIKPPLISNLYFYHFLFILNDLKSYECTNCFTKLLWNQKTIEQCFKILSFKTQTIFMCLNHNIDPLHFQKAYFVHSLINLNDFCNLGCTNWRFTKSISDFEVMPKYLYVFITKCWVLGLPTHLSHYN
jgi:hypothetical protein